MTSLETRALRVSSRSASPRPLGRRASIARWLAASSVAVAAIAPAAGCKPRPDDRDHGQATATASPADPRFDAARIPAIAAPHLARDASITIDGVLDEPAWRTAASTGPFVDVGSGRVRDDLPVGGSARVTWDDDSLYVAFEARDAKIHGGFPSDAVDPHLWDRDTCEMMIDPEGDGDNKDYYEIQIGPQNLVFDSHFDDYNLPRGGPAGPFGHQDWKSEVTSAVKVDGTLDDDSDEDRGYTVEAKLPWRSLAGSVKGAVLGKTFRVNFYVMKDNGGVAWSPILGQGNFHKASRFGRLTFVAP